MAKPTIEQVSELHRQIESGRISREALQAFLRNPEQSAPDPIFKVEVDYGKTLEAMIAAGRYDWVDSGITPERFPIQGEGKAERELVLVHLDKEVSTDEAQAELDRRGLRPAKIEELLALGAAQPELQREFPIVALGSDFVNSDGFRGFVYLGWGGGGRDLYLHWDDDDWNKHCRFLAARKSA